MLAKDEPLPRRYFDHPLGGEWNDHRDCHIRPDLILICRGRGFAIVDAQPEIQPAP
jgi:addiction module RelE/StbE family toxin